MNSNTIVMVKCAEIKTGASYLEKVLGKRSLADRLLFKKQNVFERILDSPKHFNFIPSGIAGGVGLTGISAIKYLPKIKEKLKLHFNRSKEVADTSTKVVGESEKVNAENTENLVKKKDLSDIVDNINNFLRVNKEASSTNLNDVVMIKSAKVLTTRGREHIKEENFALPGRRYPIHDRSHARSALARVSQHGTPEEKSKVRSAVSRKYPGIDMDVKQ